MAAKFEIYIDTQNQYRFRLKAGNGEIILASESYLQKAGCLNGVQSVKVHAPNDENYRRLLTRDNRHYFNLVASNYQIIGTSQPYQTANGMEVGIHSVKMNAPSAPVIDLT